MTRASTARRAGVVVTGLVALSSCNANSPSETTDDGCRDVDSAVIEEAMTSAKSNFTLPDGPEVDQVDFDDAASVALPADQQMFGAERIMALRIKVSFGGDAAKSSVSGVEDVVYLALDSDDEIIAALGTYSEPYFDLERLSDPGWNSWADKIDASDIALNAFGCVNPN